MWAWWVSIENFKLTHTDNELRVSEGEGEIEAAVIGAVCMPWAHPPPGLFFLFVLPCQPHLSAARRPTELPVR